MEQKSKGNANLVETALVLASEIQGMESGDVKTEKTAWLGFILMKLYSKVFKESLHTATAQQIALYAVNKFKMDYQVSLGAITQLNEYVANMATKR